MTSERQKWWNCLPTEEKRVRLAIEKERKYLSLYKHEDAINIKDFINYQKLLIKALRKQIAMRTVKEDDVRCCPKCAHVFVKDRIRRIFTIPNFCPDCGQKLISVCYVLSVENGEAVYTEV